MLVRITGLLVFLLCFLPKFTFGNKNNDSTAENPLWARLKPKISKGESAKLGEIPYQVSFKGLNRANDYQTFCGGTILKEKIVISAAHCFISEHLLFYKYFTGRVDKAHFRGTYAVAGSLENFVKSSERTQAAGQWRRIGFIACPYSFNFPVDDISIVHLTQPYTFDNNVAAIPYARKYNNYLGLQCLASGYGLTNFDKQTSEKYLQKAYLEIMPDEQCGSFVRREVISRRIKHICTVDKGTSVLMGDSGGPLVCKKTGDPAEATKGVLIGITSGGEIGEVAIFTRVSSFAKYIERGKADFNRNITKLQYLLLMWIILWQFY